MHTCACTYNTHTHTHTHINTHTNTQSCICTYNHAWRIFVAEGRVQQNSVQQWEVIYSYPSFKLAVVFLCSTYLSNFSRLFEHNCTRDKTINVSCITSSIDCSTRHASSGICLCVHHNFLHTIVYTPYYCTCQKFHNMKYQLLLYVMTIAASLVVIQKFQFQRFSYNELYPSKSCMHT